jgi:hypothetical protein
VTGCTGTNVPGWDGTSYLPLWPDTHKVIDDFQNNLGTNPCPA